MLLKDLCNINTKLNHSKTRTNLEEAVKRLQDTHGGCKLFCFLGILNTTCTHTHTHAHTHAHTHTRSHMHTHLLGASVQLLTSPDNVLIRIYFQDEHTKQVFHANPELICMDATYELLELRFPVYIMLVVDGNSQGEIVAVFLLQEETEDSIKSMIGIYKEHNP